MKKQRPSDLETQVLTVLWEHGPSTVRQILEKLPDGKERAYTTVLTIMQGMTRKKLVSRTQSGTAHVFHAEVNEGEVAQPVIRTLLQNLFRGDPTKVVQALLDASEVSPDELAEIRELVDAAAKKAKGASK